MASKIFEGVKILDFTWIGVGPVTIKYFADHGATVVHVESTTRPDGLRLGGPFRDNIPGNDRSGFFANFNASKYGITLNLNTPRGIEIAKRLVQWADVVAESYTPRPMKKWGLDYESLVEIKPDLIMFSTCQQGQTGPYREYAGFGNQGAALAGFYHLTGWPDRPPAGPYGAYTDFINPRMGSLAIAAALDYKRRTGKGTHIDLAQTEGGLQFLAPTILEESANGRSPARMGNRSPYQAPHGVFPCQGDERWIAIAVTNDEEWDALLRAIGDPDWAHAERFATLSGRLENQDALEEMLGAVTAEWDAYHLMYALQAAGVPAGVVQKTSDLFSDPQVAYRKHFWFLDHQEMGVHAYDGPSFRLSKTPGELVMPAPVMGQHNEYVYKEILGMSEEEYVQNLVDNIFE
ncbi:MAG: CoA transferase [Candidatus Brocadiia bacterium]|nr:CoA transferase [Candidatus Brocadiia bacterium]